MYLFNKINILHNSAIFYIHFTVYSKIYMLCKGLYKSRKQKFLWQGYLIYITYINTTRVNLCHQPFLKLYKVYYTIYHYHIGYLLAMENCVKYAMLRDLPAKRIIGNIYSRRWQKQNHKKKC